ncbi:CoA transferase [Sphingomonas sp. HITSZ_GF]|uniref:CoA transferase n=1 Tax=Sphingomonas sp. HITSZ_GF TaxID=3037247 RepID=UPI00240D8046|nr:CoA transferase [Sphingomonas sp. HITSZ_GF]MDG2533883.1 CoA transferase [Sphingomonas sp. HITSZ_GF]
MYQLLKGLSVIEASSFVASPTAGLYLAQMGAEVIRIDQAGGGPDFRRWPRGPSGFSLYWENLNRAKKSVAIDLSKREGRELMQRLAASTGQFLTNFPVDGFLAHDKLAALRTDLVTVRVMGQANGGPALDYTVNAAIGVPGLTGPASLGDEPVNSGMPAWDLLSGAYAAFAMLAAIQHRAATGQGQEVRVPLADVAIGTAANLGMLAETVMEGQDRPRLGNTVYGAFGRDFVTRDGERLMLMAMTPRQWSGMVEVLGIGAEIAAIEQVRGVSFATDEGLRYEHRDALFPLVEARVRGWDRAPLEAALAAKGCCFGGYATMTAAARDPALVTRNPMFGRTANPSGLDYPAPGPFATLPAQERGSPVRAPRLGEHSEQVLSERLGLSDGEIAGLIDAGVVARG